VPAARRPHRAHLAVLQGAQELRLDRRARLADLVEEERPAVRLLEEPPVVAVGTGERAAHVAEELALEEPFGERGAVLREEGAARARPMVVDRACQELLPRAGLALDEHRHLRLGGALGEEERVLDAGAVPDDAVDPIALAQLPSKAVQLAARRAEGVPIAGRRAFELAATERLAHDHRHGHEVLAVLHEVVDRPELHRLDRDLLGAAAGDDDDRHVAMRLADAPEGLQAVGVG
jgi:hypothetical protein